ncbi:MAG: hypothetical protein CM1200mP12_09270 [Gammaproteobacteria bacterium]|nr:MAG: hypothetical protein CM1200mP12_09270 [Gammaproteobacteria bacterium]
MTMKSGPRITMDSTRLTQHGRWKGKIQFQEEKIIIEPETYMGSRDRSWGVRPVGLPDSQAFGSSTNATILLAVVSCKLQKIR